MNTKVITEDYVSFEIAQLLKEKGFDEKTLSYYQDNVLCSGDWFEWNRSPLGHIAAPTHQMTLKWLREVHNIFIEIRYIWSQFADEPSYRAMIWKHQKMFAKSEHISYETCIEEAFSYILKNLI